MKMSSFGETIVFRCVGWRCEMRDAIKGEKLGESKKLTPVVRVQGFDDMIEVLFNNGFKSYENIFNFRFMFQRIKLNIFGVVINKYYIIFKAFM